MRVSSITVVVLSSFGLMSMAGAQTATFSGFDDAVAGRCYDPATTAPDAIDGNRLRIGMTSCTASAPNGSIMSGDTLRLDVDAPPGYFITKLTFTQSGSSSGSRGGAGFRSAIWVVDSKPHTVPTTGTGWIGTVDVSLLRKTRIPVSITTHLAAFGIQVVSGSASASNPQLVVELAPIDPVQ